jgi:DNA-binding transcriptional regulator YiaG
MTPAAFKRIRSQLGFTQTQMGQHLGGYALRTVQDWEAGERKIPHAVALILKQQRKKRPVKPQRKEPRP